MIWVSFQKLLSVSGAPAGAFVSRKYTFLDFGNISKLRNSAILCYFMLFYANLCYFYANLCYFMLFYAIWCYSCDTEGPLRIHLSFCFEAFHVLARRNCRYCNSIFFPDNILDVQLFSQISGRQFLYGLCGP